MRRLVAACLVALVSMFSIAGLLRGTTSIYGDIQAATGINRAATPWLVSLAQKRSAELVTDFSHNGWPGTTDEVIAWNSGYADPLAAAVVAWMASPDHRAILVDPSLNEIGCGWTVSGSRTYVACELIHATGASPTATPEASRVPAPSGGMPQEYGPGRLPNTAYRK